MPKSSRHLDRRTRPTAGRSGSGSAGPDRRRRARCGCWARPGCRAFPLVAVEVADQQAVGAVGVLVPALERRRDAGAALAGRAQRQRRGACGAGGWAGACANRGLRADPPAGTPAPAPCHERGRSTIAEDRNAADHDACQGLLAGCDAATALRIRRAGQEHANDLVTAAGDAGLAAHQRGHRHARAPSPAASRRRRPARRGAARPASMPCASSRPARAMSWVATVCWRFIAAASTPCCSTSSITASSSVRFSSPCLVRMPTNRCRSAPNRPADPSARRSPRPPRRRGPRAAPGSAPAAPPRPARCDRGSSCRGSRRPRPRAAAMSSIRTALASRPLKVVAAAARMASRVDWRRRSRSGVGAFIK